MNNEVAIPDYLINIANLEQNYQLLINHFPWAYSYCYYYLYVVYAIKDSIIPILKSIPESDHNSFSFEKAYGYLRQYEMSRLSFAVIIPTCDRPDAIKYLADYAAPLYRRFGIDLIIYDSSKNDKTERIVKEKRRDGYFNVIYKHYEGEFDGFSLDHKIIEAYKDFADNYDYLWLCRDGLVPVIDEIIEKIRYYKKRGTDCIIVDTLSRVGNIEKEIIYSSTDQCPNLLLDQATRLQTLGMLIFSGHYAKDLINTIPVDDKTYSLWQMSAPFHAFAKGGYEYVYFTKNVFAANLAAAPTHFWSKANNVFEQWGKRWYEVISGMPKEYNDAKEKCYKVYTVDFHPFSAKSLIEMRAYGGLNSDIIKKYLKYIPKVTNTSIIYMKIIAKCPKIVAKFIKHFAFHHLAFARKMSSRVMHLNSI